MSSRCLFAALLGGFILMGASFSARAADDPLAWPPITAQTKPWVWWWWHGSAVDQTNLAHELQRFHDAGLGGVQITTIYGVKGMKSRDIPYLTPRWLDMMGYTVDEARRLGLGVDMSLGSGWCFGGPTVSNQDANASVVVKTFDVPAGGKLTQKFNRASTQALVAFAPDGKCVELTDKISAAGEVDWTAPVRGGDASSPTSATGASQPQWTVYAISQKPSGQKVKRAAPGGEGWMLNPLYPQAMTNWLKWFDAAFANYHGAMPQAVFQDSYEYRTDWSPDFFAQFEKLRGYKLQTELPALFADTSSITNQATLDHIGRVKYDYRRTVSEIMARQSEPVWIDWAHQHGFSTIYQAHGTPGNWLDLYGDADMPETEMFHNDRSILISKFASSAAHTQSRQLVGAETGTWLKEHFTVTLADLKYLADDMFLAGVNHIYYHGACYSPDDAPWPGWLFYASTEMNPRNPIWRDVPALNAYIARCQAVLQSGQPDNDVLLYWPVADFWSQPDGLVQPMSVSKTDWFENQPIGKTAHELWNKGYSFDYISDAQLKTAKVTGQFAPNTAYKKQVVQMPGGKYQVVVVPECKYIPLETFEHLVTLAKNGATVIFQKQLPIANSGLEKTSDKHEKFQNLRNAIQSVLKKAPYLDFSESILGKGKVIVGSVKDALASLPGDGLQENLASSGRLSFIRRSFDGGHIYFVANRTETNFDGLIGFNYAVRSVVLLDPMSGNSSIPSWSEGEMRLQLAAGQSVILRVFADKKVEGPAWSYFETNSEPVAISGDWKIKFIAGGPVLPADFQTAQLASWTTFPDTNCQAFAGTAKYEITFDAPERGLSQAAARPNASGPPRVETMRGPYFLDFGDVRQSARVRLNGKDYGTLITPPFRVVVDNLKPTGNVLDVEVTSVAANRVRDLDRRGVNWKYFKDINLVNENYRPFNAADWPLTDCGLLGPVTLTPVKPE